MAPFTETSHFIKQNFFDNDNDTEEEDLENFEDDDKH